LRNALVQLRAAAFSYALFGTLFFAGIAQLVNLVWPGWAGSWSRLLYEIGSTSVREISLYAVLGIALWALAWLSLRYLTLSATWRRITVTASLLVTFWVVAAAARVMVVGPGPTFSGSPWMAYGTLWALALAYSLFSYSLWKHRRTSNPRLERP
jgi:hypothetical protein